MSRRNRRFFNLKTVSALPILGGALLGSCVGGNEASPPGPSVAALGVCKDPAAMPGGFDYPQTAATVQSWVDSGDEGRAREHGWNLWAGLNADAGGAPVWRSWCTSSQAFIPVPLPPLPPAAGAAQGGRAMLASAGGQAPLNVTRALRGLTTSEDPINFPNAPQYPLPPTVTSNPAYKQCIVQPTTKGGLPTLGDGPTLQSNGDIMVAGVIYNREAYSWIRSQQMYLAATLKGQMPPSNQARQVTPFPSGAMVLKPMMWPVQGKGYTALPVWDDVQSDNDSYAGFEITSMWPRAVAVTAQPQSQIATVDVQYLHGVLDAKGNPLGPNSYKGAGVVGVENFYAFRFPDLEKMAPCDRALLDASAYWAFKKPFTKDDYLVVIAMHIMTKEQPAWTFQSVWWHDKPNAGPYAANRPQIPGAPGPWGHYLMASTYGITQPGGYKWPIAYNPYIELAADHPIRTNCMNCHHRAAFGPGASYEAKPSAAAPNPPDALDVFALDNPIMNGILGLDAQWSVANRATSPNAGAARSNR